MLIDQNGLHIKEKNVVRGPMVIIGILFFVFGFVSWLNAILIPYFKLVCNLSLMQALLVAFAFYISYFIMAVPSSLVLEKTGFKKGMTLGLIVMAGGALIFVPAAMTRTYPLFLLGLFIQGAGLTILQTASNPYVTILGPIEQAASRISVMGVCNKTAGAIAPLILMGAITRSPREIDDLQKKLPGLPAMEHNAVLNNLSGRLILPYLVITAILLLLGLTIRLSGLPDIREAPLTTGKNKKTVFQFPHLLLGVLAIFCAVSTEVLAVDSIINYAQYQGLSFASAKYFATYTLVIMIFCYLLGVLLIPNYLRQRKALMISALTGMIFTSMIVGTQGHFSIWSVALLGLANALLWPSIWPLALDGLGDFTKKGSALLIMGIVGGALSPLLYGALGSISNPQVAYLLLFPFYIFLLYFSVSGYKAGK